MVALRTRATATTTTTTPVAEDINNWRASSVSVSVTLHKFMIRFLMIFTAFIWQLSLSPSLSLPCSEGTTGSQYAVQLVAASLSIADLPT